MTIWIIILKCHTSKRDYQMWIFDIPQTEVDIWKKNSLKLWLVLDFLWFSDYQLMFGSTLKHPADLLNVVCETVSMEVLKASSNAMFQRGCCCWLITVSWNKLKYSEVKSLRWFDWSWDAFEFRRWDKAESVRCVKFLALVSKIRGN